MNDAFEQREQKEREQRRREKQAGVQFRADVQEVMKSEAMRRVVSRFLEDSGIERTSFSIEPTVMAHATGWQDAGRWWIAAIREHCPEREAQMRAEANRDARESAKETEDDDRNDD